MSEKEYPVDVLLPAGEGGLRKKSRALCEHVITIHKSMLEKRLGRVSPPYMEKINKALKRALALDD